MPMWIIEPRDPLIVRDGRPFTATPGARATSLNFPFPSTIAGGVRTRAGLKDDGIFDASVIPDLKTIEVRGPMLVELGEEGEIVNWLCPAPSDALLLRPDSAGEEGVAVKRLVPLDIGNSFTDRNEGLDGVELSPVGLTEPNKAKGKPHNHAPRFWRWKHFERWLLDPQDQTIMLADLGHNGPAFDQRTHVSIRPDKQTAVEGALFQTRGLEFAHVPPGAHAHLTAARRLAFAVAVSDHPRAATIKPGLGPLGGERRLMRWCPDNSSKTGGNLPARPQGLPEQIMKEKAYRIVLLTPAHFERGCVPSWMRQSRAGVTTELKAMAMGRAQVVSGWDFERTSSHPNGRPKPTRRLVPAGAVFFFKLKGEAAAITKWIDETWMHCMSDDPQDRRDGFGLAALGVWDGNPEKIKWEDSDEA